jgi:MYXO-CTERM domain-containing protein
MRILAITALLALAAPAHATHELGVEIQRSSTLGPTVAADLHLRWVRIDLDWDLAEPTSGSVDFAAVDAAVNAARAKSLAVVLVVSHTPTWASAQDLETSTHRNDVPTLGSYSAFMTSAVMHFRDRVTTYELWDEPNLLGSFEGMPQQYVDSVLVPGADAVHAACPTCSVLNGGLSSAASSSWDVWLDTILTQAQSKLDGVAGHIFAGFPADDPKFGTTEDSFLNVLDVRRPTGPRSFKDVLDENACTKPFWITATGMEANTTDAAALTRQRAYVRHVLEQVQLRPWWTRTLFYDAVDAPGGTHFGLTVDAGASYTKKPAFDLLALAATAVLFGGTAPACSNGLDDDQDGQIDFPDDSDCFDPTGVTEGAFSLPDLATTTDASTYASPDGGGAFGNNGGGGGGAYMPPAKGCACSFGGGGDPVTLGGLLLLLFGLAGTVGRRQRA